MHRFWDSVIHPVFKALQPKSIVEIGVSEGRHTTKLIEYCDAHECMLHAIDPHPQCDVDALLQKHPQTLRFHRELSLNALPHIERYDAVLIDGDHNWYTVYHELLLIERHAEVQGSFPLIFLHDAGWPYGRRDMYYNPETVPNAYRHPYEQKGVIPEQGTLVSEHGFNPTMHHAIYEHSIKNGVLTAIEDFVKQSSHTLRFVHLPGIHGLGIVVAQTLLDQNAPLRMLIEEYTPTEKLSTYLSALEAERIQTYFQLLEEAAQHKESKKTLQKEVNAMIANRDLMNAKRTQLQQELSRARSTEENLQHQLQEQSRLNEQAIQEKEREIQEKEQAIQEKEREIQEKEQVIQEQSRLNEQAIQEQRRLKEQAIQEKEQEVQEKSSQLQHIINTRSWKATAFLRKTEHVLSSIPYIIFGCLHDLWTDFGQPFPRMTRFVRHRLLGRMWPAREQPQQIVHRDTPVPVSVPEDPEPEDVAVIITCSRKGGLLQDTIESVLGQTHKPKEVLVIDSSNEDVIREVASKYALKGVEYLHGTWSNGSAAKNVGLKSTRCSLLLFLTPGDRIPPEYIQAGASALAASPKAAIAYADELIPSTEPSIAPDPFDWHRFEHENYIADASLVRRDALEYIGGWQQGLPRDQAWITWRRILTQEWEAVKNPITYLRTQEKVAIKNTDTATLCLSLSGREWMWPLMTDFLEKQTYPHHLIHLVIVDTSQDTDFGNMIQQWLAECDYSKTTYSTLSVGRKGLADLPRHIARTYVAEACAAFYNHFRQYCDTPWVLFLEDDVIPPVDAFPRLFEHFEAPVVSVSALCFQRSDGTSPIAWKWDEVGTPITLERQSGVTEVGGNGFCCAVVRGDHVRNTTFTAGPDDLCHDHNFYRKLVLEEGLKALLDWSCVCRHYSAKDQWC